MVAAALATAAKVPQPTIARIEPGTRQTGLPLLTRLLAAAEFDLRKYLEPYTIMMTFSTRSKHA